MRSTPWWDERLGIFGLEMVVAESHGERRQHAITLGIIGTAVAVTPLASPAENQWRG
jgi:hypothetical protein